MGAYPSKSSKIEVLGVLESNHIDQSVIDDFKNLPETIESNGLEYNINLVSTFFSVAPMWTNFEYNYYNNSNFKTLFKYKSFTSIVDSINYLKDGIKNLESIEV